MTKPLDCTGIPISAIQGKADFKEFVEYGPEIKLTAKEAKARNWLTEEGEPTVAHTRMTYRKPDDWSKIDYPVVAPIYTPLEEHFLKGLIEVLRRVETGCWSVQTLKAYLIEILGPHNRPIPPAVENAARS